jgi:hypothetical protein
MSLVIGWIGFDKKPSSLYFAADSRISWPDKSKWDNAQKVFALPITDEIFGYCGDVLFPTQILSQITQLAQTGALFAPKEHPEDRVKTYLKLLEKAIESYPQDKFAEPFHVLYAVAYEGQLFCYKISSQARSSQFILTPLPIPHDCSAVIGEPLGSSGAIKYLKSLFTRGKGAWTGKELKSYEIFQAFHMTLTDSGDAAIGGAPQAVSLYDNGEAKLYGVFYKENKYILGMNGNYLMIPNEISWRNESFEICDAQTGKRKQDAQVQKPPEQKTGGLTDWLATH